MIRKFKIFLCIALTTMLSLTSVHSASAFGSRTHERLSELAFHEVLTDLGLARYITRLNPTLLHNCTGPDRDETKGFGGYYEAHFFNVERDLDKRDTALTRMERHYRWSIEYAQNGDLLDSVRELARALHYLQDICCPVHIWQYSINNMPANLALHRRLEGEFDTAWDLKDIMHYVPTGMQFERRFTGARDLGIYTSQSAVDRFRPLLKKYESGGIITCSAINTINPIYWVTLGFMKVLSDGQGIFKYGLEDIFGLPYLASYELVKMWAQFVPISTWQKLTPDTTFTES